jgi:hypothetical protein
MRWLLCVLLLSPTALWAASPSSNIESLASQLSPFWKTLRPACLMGLEPKMQAGVVERIHFLDERLIGSQLEKSLKAKGADRSSQWRSPTWTERDKLEKSALKPKDREALREYFFKLQTQTPNHQRAQLVADIQYMSEELNFVLRKELWKTCHGLGLAQIPVSQLETAVEKRWQAQENKIRVQLNSELAAFYFYSFRQTGEAKLKTFADVAKGLTPWVDTTAIAISEHFANLRAQLLAVPLVISLDEADVPSPEDRPWPPSPSPKRLQP